MIQCQTKVHTRWMIRRDMEEVLAIEEGSFTTPWAEEDFLRCLRQRMVVGMVAELGEKVVGFMLFELLKTKLIVLNLAVHPSYRRQRIGFQLIKKLDAKLSSHRRQSFEFEVRETNLPAQLFFKACGLRCNRIVREFFEDTKEDAFIFVRRFNGVQKFNEWETQQ